MKSHKIGDTRETLGLDDAIERARCGECGELLEWMEDFDSDGVPYAADCCGYWYKLRPQTVAAWREKQDLSDEQLDAPV